MCRGNNGQDIFITDDGRRLFLSTLDEACTQFGWIIHSYCLMANHYHLLLETPEPTLVVGMKWFQGTYTQRFNAMHRRRGHLFQGRYKAVPVQTDPRLGGLEYFRMVSSYIHLNPFRAKLAGEGFSHQLEDYFWSSYPLFISKRRKQPEWLCTKKVLSTWGIQGDGVSSRRAYRDRMERVMRFELDPDAGRRGEFDKQMKRGWYIGLKDFGETLLEKVDPSKKNADTLRGEVRKAHDQKEAERLLKLALKRMECSEQDLMKMKGTAIEKQAIAWLLSAHTSVTNVWVANRLNMGHRTNVSRALKKFREQPTKEARKWKQEMLQCTA